MPKVIITGASGLLGRAVFDEFKKQSWNVMGFAFQRPNDKLVTVDLRDSEAVKKIITDFKPDVIIHCAAERSPNKVEKNFEASRYLNVNVSRSLAEMANESKAAYLYISTDYVFDGNDPPYKEADTPNPVNQYGLTKWEAEQKVLISNPDSCILRISVLYGDEEYVGESAVSALLKDLFHKLETHVSNYETRFPSCTTDIAKICFKLAKCKLKNPKLNSVFHWCGKEAMSKYDMTIIMAEVLGLSSEKIIAVNHPVSKECTRPKNVQLSCDRLLELGIDEHTNFREGVECFRKFLPAN